MKSTQRMNSLKKIIIALSAIICVLLCLIPIRTQAATQDTAPAVTTLKNYILQNGDYEENGKYIETTISGVYGHITYNTERNMFNFDTISKDQKGESVWALFTYDISKFNVYGNSGSIAFPDGVSGNGNFIMARAPFSTSYRDGDTFSTKISVGYSSYSDSVLPLVNADLSKIMGPAFSASMNVWNKMIEQATNGRYNIGSLGFTNYIVSKPVEISMYRLYNPNSGEHFYTASSGEKQSLVKAGWRDEGIGWTAPKISKTPVYRLYNPNAGDHHYTTKKAERDSLVKAGWKYENIGWYSDDNQGKPLYREYNPNAKTGTHNYTTSKSENDKLVSLGWRAEGIGWYGIA